MIPTWLALVLLAVAVVAAIILLGCLLACWHEPVRRGGLIGDRWRDR